MNEGAESAEGVSSAEFAAPADRRALVAIDLGAESCRVSLLRWIGKGSGAQPQIRLVHRFANHAVERDGGLRWDFALIFEELEHGLAGCAAIATEGIRSIAVDGWAVDYVRLDASGEALGDPFCYRDERTLEAEKALHAKISPERMRELTGLQLLRINTVYQHFADGAEDRSCLWLNLPEYVLYRLGGRPVAELTNASHTQMLGLDGAWSEEIFAALECPAGSAAELVKPGTDVGQLRGRLAEMPAFADTRLIAPACHDTASAIAAVPDGGDDWAYISSGTWSLVGTVVESPVNSAAARAENFTNLHGVDGTICFHKNVNGMWLLRQCMEAWNAERAELTVPGVVADAAGFGPKGYVLEVDDPELLLPGQMLERINAQLKARGLPEFAAGAEHAGEVASFIFHSLSARYAAVLANLSEITGKHLSRLYIMGGGSQNLMLNHLTAEATGLKVIRAGTECSTTGNFAVQLATLEKTGGKRPTSVWAARLAGVEAMPMAVVEDAAVLTE
jgi:rhamnulokinase